MDDAGEVIVVDVWVTLDSVACYPIWCSGNPWCLLLWLDPSYIVLIVALSEAIDKCKLQIKSSKGLILIYCLLREIILLLIFRP